MAEIEPAQLITYRACPASLEQFITFWAAQYPDQTEPLYTDNIGKPLTPERVVQLYTWKNGGKLSRPKLRSVERNYIGRIDEVRRLHLDTTAQAFLDRFSSGGAIWRIFWLHCWQAHRYPIYDQHVHRAMTLIEEGQSEELGNTSDEQKIGRYLRRYVPFHRRFGGFDQRKVDRALWAFGKFMKTWRFPIL